MPPSQHSVTITLTPLPNSQDQRRLTLVPGTDIIIGRASRSKGPDFEASSTNALFDCPVVSREHAKLSLNKWAFAEEQVTLVDLGSMHGTKVGGEPLPAGTRLSLRDGDWLQFGERVTRGEDAHDGVMVTFDRVQSNNSQNSHTLAGSQPNKGYRVPYISDESDSHSADDMSANSDDEDEHEKEPASSAKTTLEQVKAVPGSAQAPIDVESVSVPLTQVIDLAAESDDEVMPPPLKPMGTYHSLKVIEDSVDKDAEILVPESIVQPTHPQALPEGLYFRSPKLSITKKMDKEQDEVSDHEVSDQEVSDQEEEDSDDEIEYGDGNDGEEDEGDKRVDLKIYEYEDVNSEDEADSNANEDYEPELFSTAKQPSPELGSTSVWAPPASATQSQRLSHSLQGAGLATSSLLPPDSIVQACAPVSHPRFDPVRSVQPPKPSLGAWYDHSNGNPMNRPTNYTYAPPPLLTGRTSWTDCFGAGYANFYGSSRWDVPPPPPAPFTGPLCSPPHSFTTPTDGRYTPSGVPRNPVLQDRSNDGVQASQRAYPETNPFDLFGMHSGGYTPALVSMPEPLKSSTSSSEANLRAPAVAAGHRDDPHAPAPFTLDDLHRHADEYVSKKTNKITIPDIMQDVEGAAEEELPKTNEQTTKLKLKRKAVELESERAGELEPVSHRLYEVVTDEMVRGGASASFWEAETPVNTIGEPAQKKAKTSMGPAINTRGRAARNKRRGIGSEIAKITGGAVLGGVATMAFLVSPLAERALEWLA